MVVIVIPAYNEEHTIGWVIEKCKIQHAKCKIIVVDDGSQDRTAKLAKQAGAHVLKHSINRGLGAALATGITGALCLSHKSESGLDKTIIVTLDADGQHDPAEIPQLIAPIIKNEAQVVIGNRLKAGMPWYRRVANCCGNFCTWFLFGIFVSDSQSGFRAFRAEAAAQLRLRTSTMEVSSEIIREIARLKLRIAEVPVTTQYTAYSLSKGQSFARGLETLWKLIVLRFFR